MRNAGYPISGNAAEFVGQVFNLRPILIGLPTRVQEPPRRVKNPPQVENLPHIRQRARLNRHRCPVAGKTKCRRDHDEAPAQYVYFARRKYLSIPAAALRPSAIAHTTSDWPRRMSPAAKTPSTDVM